MTKRTLWMYVGALLAIALFTFGCGGDDGVDQSVHDMALAELGAAEMAAAAAAAEAEAEAAAKAAAEAAAEAAAAEKAAAELAQSQAETAKAEAEAAAAMAETAQAEAEAAAAMAETARLQAEADKAAAEAAQAQAEMDAMTAAEGQMTAEAEAAAAQEMVDEAMMAETVTRAYQLTRSDGSASGLVYFMPGKEDSNGDGDYADKDIRTDAGALSLLSANFEEDVQPGQLQLLKVWDSAPNPHAALALKHTTADGITAEVVPGVRLAPHYDEYEASESTTPSIDGWDSLVLERRAYDDEYTEILYAYTDIAARGTLSFLEKYRAESVNITADNVALASSASFPSATVGMQTIEAADAPIGGTFDGVAGTFECNGTCALTWNETDGLVVTPTIAAGALTENYLTFTPTDADDSVTAGDASGEYLYFGYWLSKPDLPNRWHGFSLISGGSDPFPVRGQDPRRDGVEFDADNRAVAETDRISLVHRLLGTARFEGPAAGKYVTQDVLNTTAEIGVFTATATLVADFDAASRYLMSADSNLAGNVLSSTTASTTDTASSTSVAGAGIVNGEIVDFMDGNGESLGNWRIFLDNASLAPIGMLDAAQNVAGTDNVPTGRTAAGESTTIFVGETTARFGAAGGGGQWQGRFFGTGRADGHPNAVGGMFDAHSAHTNVSGAFGVYNQAE